MTPLEDLVCQLDIATSRLADARRRGEVELVVGVDYRAHRLRGQIAALAVGPENVPRLKVCD